MRHKPARALASASLWVIGIVASFQVPAVASDSSWGNPGGGTWSDPSNWSDNQPPSSGDRGVFDLDGSYTITLSSDIEIGGATFVRGDITLDLATRTITIDSSSPERLIIGNSQGANASLKVIGGGRFLLPASGSSGGTSVLGTRSGDDPPIDAVLGSAVHSFGKLELSGSGTRFPLAGRTVVGGAGSAELVISGGAVLSDTIPGGSSLARVDLNSASRIVVKDVGSSLNTRYLQASGGTIEILNGASANADSWTGADGTAVDVGSGARISAEHVFQVPQFQIVSGLADLRGQIEIGTAFVYGSSVQMQPTDFVPDIDSLSLLGGGSVSVFRARVGSATVSGSGTVWSGSLVNSAMLVTDGATAEVFEFDASSLTVRGPDAHLRESRLQSGFFTPGSVQVIRLEDGADAAYGLVLALNRTTIEVTSGSSIEADRVVLTARNGGTIGGRLSIDAASSATVGQIDVGQLDSQFVGPGSLHVDGTLTAQDGVLIHATGLLSGSGRIGGSLGILSGGIISPGQPGGGESPGALASDRLTLGEGATLVCDILGDHLIDQLEITEGISIEPGAALQVRFVEPFPMSSPPDEAFLLVHNDGTGELTGFFDGLPHGLPRASGQYTYSLDYHYVADLDGLANDVALMLHTVPEPSFIAPAALLLTVFDFCRTRRRQS